MTVVTISGQIGSGAREIGRLAASRLQIDYVDQEILREAARELGVPMETVASKDERTASLGERLANMLRRFLESSAAASAGDPMLGSGGLDAVLGRTYAEASSEQSPQDVSDDVYMDTLSSVIRDLAGHGDVLIIGRGSQVILKDWPNTLHALIVAPLEHRIEYVAQRDGLTPEAAAKRTQEGDKGRLDFHRKFFKIAADDPSHYHLALNPAFFGQEAIAQIIADSAQHAISGG